ncbi:MAG: rod shape-determining protein RodA [Candidatus Magasanikbacteria bacterium RIFCSPHIGHO2_02_FULL_51_14]|uniref:Rod shape-determining protein RodA n=1 Tax=Candidatus Magasanikbacteria bacterium RIFCSPHIGHO2_02_FULL_51_14 TaxID=1798683 RepID=A0A1F6MEU6_9BACT|nr:MAG: rod shape-determining protein RodA [Candidatus Magasanikbacteria bacterium RIFCSPHIGHO2_02_FULL_51_14]
MFHLARFRNYDWLLTAAVLVLAAVGFAAIYSVDLSRGDTLVYFPTQAIAFGIGVLVLLIAAGLHASVYETYAKWLYLGGFLLLAAVLVFGETVRGTTGWFRILGVSFQPAEFAKVGLVVALGWLIHRYDRGFHKPQFVVASALLALLPAGLILLQPDFGSAFVLLAVWFGMMLFSGIQKRYIALIAGALAFGFIAAWLFVFADYQKDRFLTFLNPERDPLGAGYNVTQSVIAVGSGQFFGRGLGFGSQSQLHFLPEAQTDFIFSVISEELGFLGASVVLLLFFFLLSRLLRIVRASRSEFGAYVALGILLLFFAQIMLNVGGAVGLLPITGVTLPFVSYGGSSLIMNFLLVGIAQSVAYSSVPSASQGIF